MSRELFSARASGDSAAHRREEAARWFMTLQDADLSERVLESWKRWESVPENREAFDAVERLWQLAEDVPGLPAADAGERAQDSYDGSLPVHVWRHQKAADARASVARRYPTRAFGWAAASAVIAIIIGILAVPRIHFLIDFFSSTPERTVVVETGFAEHKQILFEDGSRIQFGAQTSITAHFNKSMRRVALDRGEASFKVARDSKRPFQVRAGGGTVTAVGTAFNIQHRQDSDVTVTVTEGLVEVAPVPVDAEARGGAATAQQRRTGLRLSRGHEVSYDGSGNLGPIRTADVRNSIAWRNGYFRYSGETLRHVIEDINRYSRLRVVVDGAAAGELLYSGTVFTTDVKEWLAGLESTYPQIEVVTGESHALIRDRAPARPSK